MVKKVIHVTKPWLPPLQDVLPALEDIWESRNLTNFGVYNARFCRQLEKQWGVEHVVTFANGTQALLAALSCLPAGEKGEVITTPFTFIATTNSIIWTGNRPVFVDINPRSYGLDVEAVEAAIGPKTVAILAVHCYGIPNDVAALQRLANKYDIPLLFDAAHGFGVELDGKSIFHFGDMSVASFHATKVLNTFEGGAVACHSAVTRDKLVNFSNFGFQNETTISSLGLNAKMSEFNAVIGLLQLDHISSALRGREAVAKRYRQQLSDIPGLHMPEVPTHTKINNAYFPIFIGADAKADRDSIYLYLREYGYMVRRYFYPLTCDFGITEVEATSIKYPVPVARRCADEVLCLPIYPDLELDHVDEIVRLLRGRLC